MQHGAGGALKTEAVEHTQAGSSLLAVFESEIAESVETENEYEFTFGNDLLIGQSFFFL